MKKTNQLLRCNLGAAVAASKYLTLMLMVVPFSTRLFAQSDLTTRIISSNGNIPKKVWTIQKLKVRANDGKLTKAINNQLGVIGNDYFKEEYIGKGSIEQEDTRNTRYAIDGYKRTIMGRVTSNYFRNYRSSTSTTFGVEKNIDDDYHVVIEAAPNDPLFTRNMTRIRMEGNVKEDNPYNVTVGEIDIHQASKSNFLIFKDDMPARGMDYACLYGPWIADRGSYGFGNQESHGTYFEIHPAEQIWWTEKRTNEITYSLFAANDNSGRFDNRSDFDRDAEYVGAWTPQILTSIFAIPFSVALKEGEKQFNLLSLYEKNVHPSSDSKVHELIFNGKILVKFFNLSNNSNFTEISFDNVGMKSQFQAGGGDTLVSGFIVIKSKIGSYNTSDIAGNHMMLVSETGNLKDKLTHTDRVKIKVTLNNIHCISVDDGDSQEDIFGLIGVRVLDPTILPIVGNLLPINSNTPLLWSKLDGMALKMKKGQIETINKAFFYDVDVHGVISLMADLNEDDNNDDSNPTTSDGIAGVSSWVTTPWKKINELGGNGNKYKDDVLAKYCNVCEEQLLAGNIKAGSPITKKFQFASGGTLVEVNFTVEKIQ